MTRSDLDENLLYLILADGIASAVSGLRRARRPVIRDLVMAADRIHSIDIDRQPCQSCLNLRWHSA